MYGRPGRVATGVGSRGANRQWDAGSGRQNAGGRELPARTVRVYSTTAAISSSVRWPAPGGHPVAAVGDDGDLVGGVGISRDDTPAGEARADATGAVTAVAAGAVVAEDRGAVDAARCLDHRRGRGRRLFRVVGEQQHDGDDHGDGDERFDDVRDAPQHQRCTPMVRKNQKELVSQISTRTVNSMPPTTGSAQPGIRCERTTSTLVANVP